MGAPTHTELWTRWFNRHREARDQALPVGWYTIEELRQAFDAGDRANYERNMEIIIGKIREGAEQTGWPQP